MLQNEYKTTDNCAANLLPAYAYKARQKKSKMINEFNENKIRHTKKQKLERERTM